MKKTETGALPTLYLRSTVLGGQVVAEVSWVSVAWGWTRGYVYMGSHLLALQQSGVKFVHEDPATKSKRVTDMSGAVVSAVETDPWGADTNRNSNAAFQPKRFTSYERDLNGSDEAMHRRYSRAQARFEQPDPYAGAYDLTDPQSLNRYAYVRNNPVNLVDPTGLYWAIDWGSCTSVSLTWDAREQVWNISIGPERCNLVWVDTGPFGGGFGEGGGGGTIEPPEEKSSCEKFVDNLVSRTDYKVPTKATAANVGRVMGYNAKNQFSRNSKSFAVDGFRPELVSNGQGGDVYKHILGHAGATMIGNAKLYGWGGGRTGFEISEAEEAIDRRQLDDPNHRREAETELRDNAAGRQVGDLMRQRILGDISRDDLKKGLMNILCER